ncbi:MAG: F0F1 ATP synthase subunit B [Chloroflexota bacterium]
MEGITKAIGELGINTVGLLAQIINFTLLMILLYAFLYKPVLRMLDQRAQRVRESIDQAEEVKVQLARTREDYAAEMKRVRGEAQEVIAKAVSEGERMRLAAREEGQREAEAFLTRARAQIERDREEASRALRAEVASLALLAAGQVVGKSFDNTAHFQLIDDVLKDIEHMDLTAGR